MKLLYKIKLLLKSIIPTKIWIFCGKVKIQCLSHYEIKKTIKYSTSLNLKARKNKIELVFIIYMPEVFSTFQSIYEAAMADEKFSVHILAQPHIDNQQGLQGNNPAYEFLSKKYQNVINAYNDEEWFDLRKLQPDYVFYTRPYTFQYYPDYNPKYVRQYAKVCFHPYSYDMDRIADFFIVYNYDFMQNVTFCFNTAESTRKRLTRMLKITKKEYPQIHCIGFSRFDLIKKELISNLNQKSERKCILWLPRWASGKKQGKKQSHFFLYVKNFLEFAQNRNDVDFIIRPHPLMFANFISQGLYTQNDINDFYMKCKKLGNVHIDTEKSYLPSLKKADILFSDYTALLVEFFVTGKPIIYCDDDSTFNDEMKKMDKCFYHCRRWNEIELYLNKLLNGEDELNIKRINEIPNFLDETHAGKNIIECLKKDYYRI